MGGMARGVAAAVVGMLLLASNVRAQAVGAGAWDGCSGLVSISDNEKFELRAPPGSAGLVLRYIGPPPIDPDADKAEVSVGELELRRPEESAELVRPDGRPSLVVTGRARFTVAGPVPVSALKSAGETSWQVELKPGPGVTVRVPNGVPVRHQPVTIRPDLVPSAEGPRVLVRVSRPGEVLSEDWQRGLRACFAPVGALAGRPLEIEAVTVNNLGVADVTLRAPDDLFGDSDRWIGKASFLVYNDEAGYMAEGQVSSWHPLMAALVSAGITLGILLLLAGAVMNYANRLENGRRAFFFGLFTSRDGDASISLFQVFLWTILTVWALGYVFLRTEDVLTLTPQIMVLLGFASAASVAARWIASGRSPAPTTDSKQEPRFWAMLMTDDQPDLLKVQLFAFTLLGVAYVAWRVLTSTAFPVLDENLLLLMGVSNLAYVGGKLAEPTPYQKADALSRVRDVAAARVTRLEAELEAANKAKAEEASKPAPDQTRLAGLTKEVERLGGTDGKGGELGKAQQEKLDAEEALAEVLKTLGSAAQVSR